MIFRNQKFLRYCRPKSNTGTAQGSYCIILAIDTICRSLCSLRRAVSVKSGRLWKAGSTAIGMESEVIDNSIKDLFTAD
jgi:hypothetical protein